MLSANKKILFYVLSGFFILLNGVFLSLERFEFLLLPAFIGVLYLALFKMDILFKLVVFFVPLSVSLSEIGIDVGVDMALPTEPLIFGMLIIFILKLLHTGSFDQRILKHPITIIILLQIGWIAVTTLSSSMPMVSIKYLISRIWFVVVFYFIAAELFKRERKFDQFFWLYTFGMLLVLFYTNFEHSKRGFDQESANWVMNPFFNDHTSYGAVLAMILFFLLWKFGSRSFIGFRRTGVFILLSVFVASLVFSYTRAAWLSVIGALGVYIILLWRVKLWLLGAFMGLGIVIIIASWDDVIIVASKNKQDSSSNLKEHVASMSNVSSDASNLERINRWTSAWEMFKERPVVGFGPGVYAFEYAPYQRSVNKTIISTNAGDGGNAHSEYLGPLSEQGVLGSLLMVLLVIFSFISGVKIYKHCEIKYYKTIATVAFLGLVTYYIHGVLNNFLDTDKASCLFWGFTAILVVIETYFMSPKTIELLDNEQK